MRDKVGYGEPNQWEFFKSKTIDKGLNPKVKSNEPVIFSQSSCCPTIQNASQNGNHDSSSLISANFTT